MPENDKILAEPDRIKLDGIVDQMVKNSESDEDIQFVVNDFKEKYGSLKKKEQPGAGLSPYVSAIPSGSIKAEDDFTGFVEQGLKEKPKEPDMTMAEATDITRKISGYQPSSEIPNKDQIQERKINDYLTVQSGGDPAKLEKLRKGIQPGGITSAEKPGDEEFNSNKRKVEILTYAHRQDRANISQDIEVLQQRKTEAAQMGDMETAQQVEAQQKELAVKSNAIFAEQQELLLKNPDVADKILKQQEAAQKQIDLNKKAIQANQQGGSTAFMQQATEVKNRALNALAAGTSSFLVAVDQTISKPTAKYLFGQEGNNYATDFIQKTVDNIAIPVANIPVYDEKSDKYNFWRLAPNMTESIVTMAMIAAGGKGIMGTTGLSATRASQIMGSHLYFDASLRDAYAEGMDDNAATAYAALTASIQGAMEGFMPDANIVFGGKNMAKQFAKDFLTDRNLAVKSLKEKGFQILAENGEEFLQNSAEKFGNYLTNTALNTELDDSLSWEETVNTALLTTPTVLLMGAGNHVFSNSRESQKQIAQLAMNPQESLQVIDELDKSGQFKPENVAELKKKVQQYSDQLKKMPADLEEEKKISVVPLAVEREELAEQNKNIIKPLQAINNEKIDKLDEEILKIADPELAAELNKESETKKPKSEAAPAPAAETAKPTTDGKINEKGRKKGRQDVLTPEAPSEEGAVPVKKAIDQALKSDQGIQYAEKDGVGVEFEKHKDGIRLSSLKSEDKGKGNASRVMKEVTKQADEDGIPVYLDADAKKGGMPQEELVKFYQRNGFVFEEGSTEAVRQPAPKLTEEQKAADNIEAEKLGFENAPQALNSIAKRTGQYYTSWEQVPDEIKAKVSLERTAEKSDPAAAKLKEINAKKQVVRDRIKAKTQGRLSSIPADLIGDYLELGALYIQEGYVKAKDFIKKFREENGDIIGDVTDEEIEAEVFSKITQQKPNASKVKGENTPAETSENTSVRSTVKKKVKKKKKPSEKEEFPREKRRFTQQVLNNEETPERLKEAVTKDQVYYNRLPNKLTLDEANFILDRGENAALNAFTDYNNNMEEATRFTLGSLLLKRFQQYGEYDDAIAVLDIITKRATKAGQGIQALSMFQFLTPQGQLRYAQREVNKQREDQAKRDKKKTRKLISGLKKANSEAIDEALESPEVKKKIEKIQRVEPKISTTKDYGSSNKVVTKERYTELLKNFRGKTFSNPLAPEVIEIAAYHLEASGRKFADFSENMIRDLGGKIKPYLKEIYDGAKEKLKDEYSDFDSDKSVSEASAKMNTDHLVKKMEKALAGKNKKQIDQALAQLQQASKENGLWGKYKDMAVARLKNLSPKQIGDDINSKPVLEEFTNGLIKNISQQVKDGPSTKLPKNPKPPIEIIADAYKNFEKYADVWTDTVEAIKEKYKENPGKLEELDAYFGEILRQPFSDKLIEAAVKTGMKDLGQDLREIVKSHYTVSDHALAELGSTLQNKAGLSEAEAAELSKAIEKEFDRIATAKKQQILNQMFSTKERKKPEVKTLESELIKLTNLGAFSDAAILEKYADKMGYPKLTPENIQTIEKLATRIEHAPDGIKKFRAIEDLLTYQQSIQGMSKWDTALSLWYASILSGHQTQITNGAANAFNTGFLFANAALQNPKNSIFLAKGLWDGWMRGLSEGKEVLRTGYNPIRENKVEVPPVLEWKKFAGGNFNPANYAKYVRRLMVAVDTVFFEGIKSMRAYQLAAKQAAKDGRIEPDLNQRNRALEILNKTDKAYESAKIQADLEYKVDFSEISADTTMSDKEKAEKIAQAKRDIPRRIYEIMEKGRGEQLLKDSHSFAARGTFNFKPEGTLGYLSQGMNKLGEWIPPVKLVVPFTNIIANVANEALNYTPYGAFRARAGGSVLDYVKKGRVPGEMTDQEKVDTMVKAFMGTVFMTTFFILSGATGGDDEPTMEVTANGYGNYRDNFDLKDWQPYSFRMKIGKDQKTGKAIYGPWMSYRLTPMVLSMALIGNIRDYEKYRKGKLSDNGLWTKISVGASQIIPTFMDMTFLSSASAFMKMFSDTDSENIPEDVAKSAMRTLKGFVVPNIYTQAAKEFQDWMDIPDKEVGVMQGFDGMMNAMKGEFIRDIPVARDTYYNKINGLGEEIIPETSRIITNRETSPEWNLLKDKKAKTTPPSIKTVTVWGDDDKERFLTREEYYNFSKNRGKIMKEQLTKNMETLSKMPQEDFDKEWAAIKSYATSTAKVMVTHPKYVAVPMKPVKHVTEEQKTRKRRKERAKIERRVEALKPEPRRGGARALNTLEGRKGNPNKE